MISSFRHFLFIFFCVNNLPWNLTSTCASAKVKYKRTLRSLNSKSPYYWIFFLQIFDLIHVLLHVHDVPVNWHYIDINTVKFMDFLPQLCIEIFLFSSFLADFWPFYLKKLQVCTYEKSKILGPYLRIFQGVFSYRPANLYNITIFSVIR